MVYYRDEKENKTNDFVTNLCMEFIIARQILIFINHSIKTCLFTCYKYLNCGNKLIITCEGLPHFKTKLELKAPTKRI